MNSSSENSNIHRSIISLNDVTSSINANNYKVMFFPTFMNCLFYNENSIIIVDLFSQTISVKLSFPKETISNIKILNSNTIAYIKHYNTYDQIIVTNLKCLDELCELKIKNKVYDFLIHLNENNNCISYIFTKDEMILVYNDNNLITTTEFGSLLANSFNNISFSLIETIQLFHIDKENHIMIIIFKNGKYIILNLNQNKLKTDYSQNSFGNLKDVKFVKIEKFEHSYKEEDQENWIYFLIVLNYIEKNNYKHIISGFKINANGEYFYLGNIMNERFVVDCYLYGNDNLDKHFLYCMCLNNTDNNYFIKCYDIVNFIFENEEEFNQEFLPIYKEVDIPILKEGSSIIGISGVSLIPAYNTEIDEDNYSEYISFDILTKLIQNNYSFSQITIDISQPIDDIVTADVNKFTSYCNNQDKQTIQQKLFDKLNEIESDIKIKEDDPWEKMYLIYLIYCGNIFSIKKYLWLRDNNNDNYLVSTEVIENTYNYMINIIRDRIKQQQITKKIEIYIKLLLEIIRISQNRTYSSNKKMFHSEQILLNEVTIINSNRIFELENYLLIVKLETLHEQYDFLQLDLDNVNYLYMFSMIQNKSKLISCSEFINEFIEMISVSENSSMGIVPLYKTLFYTKFVLFLYYYFAIKKSNKLTNENKTFLICNSEYKQFHLICEIIFDLDTKKNKGSKIEITDTHKLAFINLFTQIMEEVPIAVKKEVNVINNDNHLNFMSQLKELLFAFIKALVGEGYTNEAFILGYEIEPYITDMSMREHLNSLLNSFQMIPFLSELN